MENVLNRIVLCVGLILGASVSSLQGQQVNYDEAKVPAYTLPDSLKLEDGTPVANAEAWPLRRAEILELFRTHMFGRSPQRPDDLTCEVFDQDEQALGGKAIRKQVTIHFSAAKNGPSMDLLLYVPKQATQPVPAFLGLNFGGNQAVHADPGIRLSKSWMREGGAAVVEHQATEASRGAESTRWQLEEVLARGYALATVYYGDIDPDFDDGFQNGIHPLFYAAGQTRPASDEWGSIAAWAWGLSRALDYLETDARC